MTPSLALNPAIAAEMYLDTGDHARQARLAAEERIQELIPPALAASGVVVTSEAVVHGDTAAAICEAAEHFGTDVICMGSHGHSRMGVALLGPVAQSVIARAHRPVLVVCLRPGPEVGPGRAGGRWSPPQDLKSRDWKASHPMMKQVASTPSRKV